MIRKLVLPMTLAGLCATQAATAATGDGRWDTTIWAGPLFTPRGTMSASASGNLENLGTLDAAFAGDPGTTTLQQLSFHDVFRTGETLGAEFAYRSGGNFEPFARLSFSRIGGKALRVGEIRSDAFTDNAPITMNFNGANSTAITVGARYFLAESGALHPFVTAYVGADHMDTLRANVAVVRLDTELHRQDILPNATRFEAGMEAGLSYQLRPGADLRLSVGAERVSADAVESNVLEPFGVGTIRMAERRWSIPASIGVDYRF